MVVAVVVSGSPSAAVRSAAAGTGSSDSAGSSWLSPSDLGMRSDTLVSPRVSPLMQHRRVPSLVITSSIDKSGKVQTPLASICCGFVRQHAIQAVQHNVVNYGSIEYCGENDIFDDVIIMSP